MRDLYSNIEAVQALAPAVQASATTGDAIDVKGANRIAIIVNTGAIASAGDFGVKLQESDTTTSGDFADVAAAQVQSDAPATLAAASAYRLGYLGFKRYIRVALTKAGGTSIVAGATAIRADLAERP